MNKNNGSALFLMEMICVVGFFMICACICVSVFVKANTISISAQENNRGLIFAESIAEVIKEEGVEFLPQYWNGSKTTENKYEIKDGEYIGIIDITYEENMQHSDITIYTDNRKLYTLDIKKYQKHN